MPSFSQLFPGEGDNIDYLVTSGKNALKSAGDDDHQQIIFFLLPKNHTGSFYIRIYDPETSGAIDEKVDSLDTKTRFTVYGGKGNHSDSVSRSVSYQKRISGVELKKRTFGATSTYQKKWFTFGPFNPKKGEFDKTFNGYVFKLVIEGISGDDVNLYKLGLSSSNQKNIAITGANIFTYEYSFRLKSESASIAHLYPYMDKSIVSIKQFNFDADSDAVFRLFSSQKKGELAKSSGNGNWVSSKHYIKSAEKGKCLDLQLKKKAAWHNDIVVYVLNQYNQAVPFFASPIGGAVKPKFKFNSDK